MEEKDKSVTFLVGGLIMIVIGLLIIIFWQRGLVQIQPLLIPCEKQVLPIG